MPGQRQGGEHRCLRLVQGWGGDGFRYHAAPAFVASEPAAPLQIHQPGGRGSAGLAQRRFIRLAMLCEKCQRRRLFRAEASRLRRHACLRQPPTAQQLPQDRPPFAQRHGQRRLHHLADRVLVIAGGEAQQGELRGIKQRRGVQHRLDRFQPIAVVHRRYRQHHADDVIPSERHPHPRPDCNGVGAEIIETSGQRARHSNADLMHGGHGRSLKSAWLTCLAGFALCTNTPSSIGGGERLDKTHQRQNPASASRAGKKQNPAPQR